MALAPAEIIKRQANEAFKAGDYQVATSLYTHAMGLDAANPLYVLNRAMSNLNLANWKDAETDATLALDLSAGNTTYMQKALFRRSRARRVQGDLTGARADMKAFVAHGGKPETADKEIATDPLAANATPGAVPVRTISPTTNQTCYEIKNTLRMGKGAFATRALHRGDLILAEKPLISHQEIGRSIGRTTDIRTAASVIISAINRLSPSAVDQFLSLHNSHSAEGGNIFVDIYRTNALPEGLCVNASRFNHSCLPNARYSWHAESGQHRIFALADIALGDEIQVTYLGGRNVYGSTREQRQRRFLNNFGSSFVCLCAACSLAGADLKASDDRRREIAVLYDRMMTHEPEFHGQRVVDDAVRAIRLLREEGYAADVDDFATDAGGLCAMHSDWESARYWAKLGYDSRCAEFGKDHEHARVPKRYCDDLHTYPQAGMYSGRKFPLRV
ncbi:hypothetical protein C8R44DRAFT_808008 [Mycena epipterygia]|nr:hypothetical protein C8R44DRAFT_808008 [Mycena epipterygia]